jgi:hypothetical protein
MECKHRPIMLLWQADHAIPRADRVCTLVPAEATKYAHSDCYSCGTTTMCSPANGSTGS